MRIKTTADGREVTVESGFVCLAGKRVTDRITPIPQRLKARAPDAEYLAGNIGLTLEQGKLAKAEIRTYRVKRAAEELARLIAEQADLPRYRVLIRSGSYLMDTAIATVVAAPYRVQARYRDDLRGHIVVPAANSVAAGSVMSADSPTARSISCREDCGLMYGPGESRMWLIGHAEEAAIVSECLTARRARQEKQVTAENEARAKRDTVFAEATRSGKRQILDQWITDECTDPTEIDCSFDAATSWAMPDGSTKTTYQHCH